MTMDPSIAGDTTLGPIVEVRGLRYAYPQGVQALQGIDFALNAGESLGLIGSNGAGKTTLFMCLAGVCVPEPGMVRVAELDPAKADARRRLPAVLGVVFQNSDDQLFNTTVYEDVAFGPLNLGLSRDEVRQRVAEALRTVGLEGREQRAPFHLSGGEKRRAALAGVLAMRPDVLLLDEPSIFLDPRGRRELLRLLKEWRGTKIIAAHDLEMIREACSRVLLLDGGRVAALGPTDAILADAALMDRHGLEVPWSLRR